MNRNHYNVDSKVIFCPDYGIPQTRRRFVLVASLFDPINIIDPTHNRHKVHVKDYIGNLPPIAAGGVHPNDPMHRSASLSEKKPVITLYEDGVKTREYRLQTENDENFKGKYFHISVRVGWQGDPCVLAAQIDGFISDIQQEHQMKEKDIGYRMEAHFLSCCGEDAKKRYEMLRRQDLPMKALKYVGYTIPSTVRLIGICPECGKSFCFHGYCVYMGNCDVAYSDDGLDCCQIQNPNISKDDWSYEENGKIFRYYNSFSCPHCGTPYIDYKQFPQNKKYGVCGCVHLGREIYTDKS